MAWSKLLGVPQTVPIKGTMMVPIEVLEALGFGEFRQGVGFGDSSVAWSELPRGS